MAGVSSGRDGRPLDDTIAETGTGLPDDAVGEGQMAPGDLGADADAKARALKETGWVDGHDHTNDPQGHPS